MVGKVFGRVFPDGLGVQTGKADGVSPIGIGPRLAVLVLTGFEVVILVHKYIIWRIGYFLGNTSVCVGTDVAYTADGGYLVPDIC